jgi:DNA polymerase-3 subunit gamma/tau
MHKVPETIISRCEVYTFKKPTQALLVQMVSKTAKAEGITLESSAADLIALLGDSSFRDTHGILQKIIRASKDSKITIKEVERIAGAPNGQLVNQFIEAISKKDIEQGLSAINSAVEQNIDMNIFLSLILIKIRAILLSRYSKNFIQTLQESVTDQDFSFIQTLAQSKDSYISSLTLKVLLDAYTMISKSYTPHVPLEIALFDLIT